jgi:hypothetical protein
MTALARLLTFVDIDEADDGHAAHMSTKHVAVLADGRRVVLLDDRGWSSAPMRAAWGAEPARKERLPDVWEYETAEEIERTARFVVGPDEPFEGRTQAEMEDSHWDYLARLLQREGVEVQAVELRKLPHDVELSERLLARLGTSGDDIS